MILATLRAINHRLTTTSVNQLPHVASFIAASLSDCEGIFSASWGQKHPGKDSQTSLEIHKLKARLTNLLQDRSLEGRFTGVILVKALVEVGRWEILRDSEPWVRGLISIFAKQDPISTKKLSIIALSRIFHLTYQYPTLVREITTPSLPAFITASLNLVSAKPSSEPARKLKQETPLLETILDAFASLITKHPNIFRPFSAQIHSLLLPVLGRTSSCQPFPESVVHLARQLFVFLHHCAPKNTTGDEWTNACQLTISSIHRTANYVFRAVVEQWESTDPQLRHMANSQDYSRLAGDDKPDPLGLPSWRGVHSGADRLLTLLFLLSGFLSNPTASTVNIPLGDILDMTSRLTSIIAPKEDSDEIESSIQLNLEISREEREELWTELPRIHTACMDVLSVMIDILGAGIISITQTVLEQALCVFDADSVHRGARASSYKLITKLLSLIGPSMTKDDIDVLSPVFLSSCQDLLPPDSVATPQASSKPKDKNQRPTNTDVFLKPCSKVGQPYETVIPFPSPVPAASQLLSTSLSSLPVECFPHPLRAQIDRTVILVSDQNTMLASVMNPTPTIQGHKGNPSILPFLARRYPHEIGVECLLRPRMPVIMGATNNQPATDDKDDDAVTLMQSSRDPSTSLGNRIPSAPVTLDRGTYSHTLKRDFPEVSRFSDSPTLQTTVYHGEDNDTGPQPKKVRIQAEPDDEFQTTHALLQGIAPISTTGSLATAPFNPETEAVQVASPITNAATAINTSAPSVSDVNVRSLDPVYDYTYPTSIQAVNDNMNIGKDQDDDDEELPALNIEPDTDENEDQEDDLVMKG